MSDYGFGLAQEDERVEAAIFGAPGPREGLCVASGGEVPLGLVARGFRVVAVDSSPGQLRLVRLKHAAALRLEPADAAGLLGYAAVPADRRRALWAALREHLPAHDRAAWEADPDALARGPALAGRFERYVGRFLGPMRLLWGRDTLDALCAAPDLEAQRRVYEAGIERPWVRAAFRLAFRPALYRRRGLDERALAQRDDAVPLAEQYLGWLRAWCTATPAADNWFLQVLLRGGLVDPERGPDWLRPAGVAALRAAPDALRLVEGDATRVLAEAPEGSLGAAHLSNLGDWLDAEGFAALLGAAARALAPGAPFAWRELQTRREVPAALADRMVVDRPRGEALRAEDRFPFYRIVPGRRG